MCYIALTTAVLIYAALPATAVAEVFLTCNGTHSTEYPGHGPPTSYGMTVSVKIDPEKHLFSWSVGVADDPSCFELSHPSVSCSNVITSDVKYQFRIQSSASLTQGTIDRVSGKLYAREEAWDRNDAVVMRGEWFMTCAPATRQF